MVDWTEKQEEAIYKSGSDILVSAAAGSGKTAVLVERIIQKLLHQETPVDIDSLLVVTFTNAAAQEMRTRVGIAIEKALSENPNSIHLKKQLSLLQRASISTLHSFCMEVVRNHAYLLDLDPRFRIANTTEGDHIKQEVLEDLFEEWYGTEDDGNNPFFDVVNRFSSDRNDIEVEELILSIYQFAIQNPWPDEWLDQIVSSYMFPDHWTEDDIEWLPMIKQEIITQLEAFEEEVTTAEKIIYESDGPFEYAETIEADKQMLSNALENTHSWEALREVINESKFKNLKKHKAECNEDKQKKVKDLRDSYKKRWQKMQKDWFKRDLSGHVADMKELAPIVKQLALLVKQFKERFTIQKKEKGIVDFSDLEHYCLQLLMDEDSTVHHIVPSQVAKGLQAQFSELLVDEYQDTNLVQETILKMISDQVGAGNMFMVGDVKQSIYRFRHAEPSLFIDKYKRYYEADSIGNRIDLSNNFRSREQVLVAVNYIFKQILDEKLGEINYDQEAELIYANSMYDEFPLVDSEPELVIIDRDKESEANISSSSSVDEDFEDLENAQLEARVYAQKIKGWIAGENNSPLQVVDKATGKQRDVQYRDIVILMRSMTWAPSIVEEFKKQGIPIYAEIDKGYFDAIEVKIMMNFLKIIDNPRQDIPLASVLKSPIVGLNEEELASVRLANQHDSYFEALKAYETNGKDENILRKMSRFMNQLEDFRRAARQGALSELIWSIYRETGYYDYVAGMPGGRQRQANLRALYDRARGYETTSFRGLFRFLRFIERMEENKEDLGAARALSEQEDVVRMTTIHKSKGLEFPVVIVGGINREFNRSDTQGKFMLHKDLGFATRYIDPIKRISYPTLFYQAMKNEKKLEMLAEEMRVLYVAVTRAKEKLVLIGNVSSFQKEQAKWEKMVNHPEWVLPAYFRSEAKTYLDWIGPALIRHQDTKELRTEEVSSVVDEVYADPSTWNITILHGSELVHSMEHTREKDVALEPHIKNWIPVPLEDEGLDKLVESRLSYRYPYQEATVSRAKQTVTELKRQQEFKDEYSGNQLVQDYRAPIVRRPVFMQTEKHLSAAEKGTAMHTVMQHIPFRSDVSIEALAELMESLVMEEKLTRAEAEVINLSAIKHFLDTDIAQYMMTVTMFYRELPFSLTLPAEEVYANWTGEDQEQVLIQGVLDCVIPNDNGWIILDYKTDTIEEEVDDALKKKLTKRYETQMKLYKKAIETIWKQPVKATYLYFFSKELVIEVPTDI